MTHPTPLEQARGTTSVPTRKRGAGPRCPLTLDPPRTEPTRRETIEDVLASIGIAVLVVALVTLAGIFG